MSNLNHLNTVLFDTLDKVHKGVMDPKQASAIVGVSNTIINNGKLQIQVLKQNIRKEAAPELFKLPQNTQEEKQQITIKVDKGENKKTRPLAERRALAKNHRSVAIEEFAEELGYRTSTTAKADIGKESFEKKFEHWLGAE